jgi:hypothetical protein
MRPGVIRCGVRKSLSPIDRIECASTNDRSVAARMQRRMIALLAGGVIFAASDAVLAHHSFAMFDQANPIELEGIVQEFKYTNPHSYLLLEVKGDGGESVVWNLEGSAPSILGRDGWSKETLKPGDHVLVTIDPLRSGAPGGSWNLRKIKFKDGRPIVAP